MYQWGNHLLEKNKSYVEKDYADSFNSQVNRHYQANSIFVHKEAINEFINLTRYAFKPVLQIKEVMRSEKKKIMTL